MKKIFFLSSVSILFFINTVFSCETRGSWINSPAFENTTKLEATFSKLEQANINTIFVPMPSVNDNFQNYYGLELVSGDTLGNTQRIEEAHQRFMALCQLAEEKNISVQGWINNKYRNAKRSWEWGNFIDTQVDFTDPNERLAQVQWVEELMNEYGDCLDGVHLDYIRYEWNDQVNMNQRMDGVTDTVRQINNSLKSQHPNKYLSAAVFTSVPTFVDFTTEDVPAWYRNWYSDNPGNYFESAYSFDTVPVHMKFQQNPIEWINEGIIDAVMPMQYDSDINSWNQEVSNYENFLNYLGKNMDSLNMGIGWYPAEWGNTPEGVEQQILDGRSKGLTGFILYQIGYDGVDDSPLIEKLKNGVFASPEASCLTKARTQKHESLPPSQIVLP